MAAKYGDREYGQFSWHCLDGRIRNDIIQTRNRSSAMDHVGLFGITDTYSVGKSSERATQEVAI